MVTYGDELSSGGSLGGLDGAEMVTTVLKGGLDGATCGMVDWLEQWIGAFILR